MADLTIREKFFNDLAKGARWDVGVSIARGNPLPLDANSVFKSLADLEAYAAGVLAYPGQVVAIVNENSAEICYLDQNLAIQPVGIIPVGDESTVTVDENGKVSLAGVEGLTFTETTENGDAVDIVYQALLTKDGLTWVRPDTTTVEGLQASLEGLQTRVGNLSNKIDGEIARAKKAEEDLDARIDSEVADLAAEDALIRAIAEGVRADFDTFMTSEEVKDTVDTLKEIQLEIEKMTDATELEKALAAKADKTETENTLATKADKTETENALATKAEKTYVDDNFATKTQVGEDLLDLKNDLEDYASGQANDALTTVANTYATIATVNAIDGRVAALEDIDHSAYATKEELNAHKNSAEETYAKKTDLPEGLNGFDARITAAKEQADKGVNDASAAAAKAEENATNIAGHGTRLTAVETLINGNEEIDGLLTDVANLKLHDSTHKAEFDALSKSVTENATAIGTKADADTVNGLATTVGQNQSTIAAIINPETGILAQANAEIAKKANTADVYNKKETEDLIKAAKDEATYDDTNVKNAIKAIYTAGEGDAAATGVLADEIARAKAAEKANADEIAKIDAALKYAVENNEEGIDSIKELASWLEEHDKDVLPIVNANKDAIATITDPATGVLAQAKAYTNEKIGDIPTATKEILGLVKYDDATIKMNASNQLYVAEVSTDLLAQGEKTIILNGGSANIK